MATALLLRATPKGLEEISRRTGELSMMERRMLILADGKRSTARIGSIMKKVDLPTMIKHLVATGFLEAVQEERMTDVLSATTANSDPEEDFPADDLGDGDAKQQMLVALDLLTDPSESNSVRQKISNAGSDEDLRDLMEEWFERLSVKPENKRRADLIREKVNKSIMSGYMILF